MLSQAAVPSHSEGAARVGPWGSQRAKVDAHTRDPRRILAATEEQVIDSTQLHYGDRKMTTPGSPAGPLARKQKHLVTWQ